MTKPGDGDDFYRVNGAGEMLVYSAADFEDILEPRPDMAPVMESEIKAVVRHLVENRWPFRLHTTYDETIGRALNVYEEINREIPFNGLHWFFDHCETVSDRNIERIKALGGGIAIQNRMAFQGEYFVERYGAKQAERTPPIRRMLQLGVPVGAGTDATRVSSYNPWLSLYWLVTGKTVGGLALYPENNRFEPVTLSFLPNLRVASSKARGIRGGSAVDVLSEEFSHACVAIHRVWPSLKSTLDRVA